VPRPALFLVLAAILLPACGWREEPVGERADRFPVQVADAVGAVVEVAGPPATIVSLSPDATETLRALGYEGELVEVEDPADLPAIAAAEPDLVVAPYSLDEEQATALVEGSPAPVFRFGAVTFDDAPRVVARLAQAVGRGPEGVELAGALRTGIASALERAAAAGPVRVFIDGGGLFTALGPETPYGRLLATVGAESVVPQTRTLRFSALARTDPDAWVLTPEAETTMEQLRDPASPLAEITAVAEGRVFGIDLADFGVTPRLPEALDRLVEELHAPPSALPPLTDAVTGTDTPAQPSGTEAATGAGE
jgi:iron complex transport system substrate-binding protein